MDQAPHQAPTLRLVSGSKNNGEGSEELRDLLGQARQLCENLGDGFQDLPPRLGELQQRLDEERFHLAVLGQFKRGKSTLLNALLGEPLLPTGVVPLTSIPTFLRAGKMRAVRVFFHDGRETAFSDLTREQASAVLARHVTEKENPKNQLGVARVEVEHPAALLRAGVVMIDTPGIGSTLRHNTEATLNFLPQCDAALFIVSADPPITEVEQEFLKSVRHRMAKLCFVMNKIDYLSEGELADAMIFFDGALRETEVGDSGSIFRVSAKLGIEARVKENAGLWHASGLEPLQKYLLDFLAQEKSRTLQTAIARKAIGIVADAAINIRLQLRALELSQQELERRIELFDGKVSEIEHETLKMGDLLAGDKTRTAQLLEDLAETLRRDAREHLWGITSETIQNGSIPAAMERQIRERIADEIPAYFAEKLASFASEINRALQQVILPYQERVDGLISALRSTAAELFDIPYRAATGNGTLKELHKPYWVTQKWSTSVSPVPEGFLDRFLPLGPRKHRLEKRLSEEMETLVIHNVENLRWATLRNLDDAFRRFSSTVDQRLKDTTEATRAAMRAAHARRDERESSVQPEVKRLQQRAAELACLENRLGEFVEFL